MFIATGIHAETVILACVADPPGANICPSHWVINSDTRMVTWRWCKSKDTTEQRNVEMTPERITFDEDFMERHYIFDRRTGRMTITAVGMSLDGTPGERFDDGESLCRVVQK
jgi:hypothetical protein